MYYIELRCAMIRAGIDQNDIARTIGKSPSYVSLRLNGHVPWTMAEAYAICELLQLPITEIVRYFPPGGKGCPIWEAKKEEALE